MKRRPPPHIEAVRLSSDVDERWLVSFPIDAADALTDAESQLLVALVAGRSNRQIASERKTSLRTVANQVASLLKKCGASSRADLATRWAEALTPRPR